MSKGTLFIVRSALSEHPTLSSIISKEDGVLLRAEACYNASAFVGLGVDIYALEQVHFDDCKTTWCRLVETTIAYTFPEHSIIANRLAISFGHTVFQILHIVFPILQCHNTTTT